MDAFPHQGDTKGMRMVSESAQGGFGLPTLPRAPIGWSDRGDNGTGEGKLFWRVHCTTAPPCLYILLVGSRAAGWRVRAGVNKHERGEPIVFSVRVLTGRYFGAPPPLPHAINARCGVTWVTSKQCSPRVFSIRSISRPFLSRRVPSFRPYCVFRFAVIISTPGTGCRPEPWAFHSWRLNISCSASKIFSLPPSLSYSVLNHVFVASVWFDFPRKNPF